MRRSLAALGAGAAALCLAGTAAAAESVTVHVNGRPAVRQNVRVDFHARALPGGGYYYAVIVLKPYRGYTRSSPPPCSTSSDMQRTDYGYPQPTGEVGLVLTPAKSLTWHWCPGGHYTGAIYAVPHAPPCESSYPCRSEPYKEPCSGVGPGCVLGLVAWPAEWRYPQGLPSPHASGTSMVGHFAVSFPSSPGAAPH